MSVLSEPDLEMITNMDPNSVADITGKDFIEQLKEVSGRLGGGKSNLSWDLSPYIFHLHCIWCVAKNHFVSYFPFEQKGKKHIRRDWINVNDETRHLQNLRVSVRILRSCRMLFMSIWITSSKKTRMIEHRFEQLYQIMSH